MTSEEKSNFTKKKKRKEDKMCLKKEVWIENFIKLLEGTSNRNKEQRTRIERRIYYRRDKHLLVAKVNQKSNWVLTFENGRILSGRNVGGIFMYYLFL